MRWIIVGVSLACLCPAAPASAEESELLHQFRLFLKSPAGVRTDDEFILKAALKSTDPEIRQLAGDRLKEIWKTRPKNAPRPKVVKGLISHVGNARLAVAMLRSLQTARDRGLRRASLTLEQAEAILKSGRGTPLPPVLTAASQRIPVLTRIRNRKLLDYFHDLLSRQKTPDDKLNTIARFDPLVVIESRDTTRRMDYFRRRNIAMLADSDLVRQTTQNKQLTSTILSRDLVDTLREFRLPRSVVMRIVRPLLSSKTRNARYTARHIAMMQGTTDDFLLACMSAALIDEHVPYGDLGDVLDRLRPEHRYAKAYLTRFYSDQRVDVRSDVIAAAERTRRTDRTTQVLLRDSLTNDDFFIRVQTRFTLRKLGVSKRVLEKDLIPALKSKDVAVLKTAARRLQSLGRSARPAKPELEKLLTHTDEAVRFRAAAALYRAFDEAERYVPPLVQSLDAKDAAVRLEAIRSLTQFGPAPPLAIPVLLKRLSDPNKEVVTAALDALKTAGEQ